MEYEREELNLQKRIEQLEIAVQSQNVQAEMFRKVITDFEVWITEQSKQVTVSRLIKTLDLIKRVNGIKE